MRRKRDHVITFKVSAEEFDNVKQSAEKEKMTLSEYCRASILRDRFTNQDLSVLEGFFEGFFGSLFDYLDGKTPEASSERQAAKIFEKKLMEKMQRAPKPEWHEHMRDHKDKAPPEENG